MMCVCCSQLHTAGVLPLLGARAVAIQQDHPDALSVVVVEPGNGHLVVGRCGRGGWLGGLTGGSKEAGQGVCRC